MILAVAMMLFVGSALAQNSDEYKVEFDRYMGHSGTKQLTEEMVGGVLDMMLGGQSADVVERVKIAIMEPAVADLMDRMLVIYQENISMEDLKAYNDFFETPAGKRVAEKLPVLMQAGAVAGQEWGSVLVGLVEAELEKQQ